MATLRLLLASTLAITPGAWAALGLCDRGFPRRVKAAIALCLSPGVLAVEIVAMSCLGVAFAQSAIAMALANLMAASAAVLFRRHKTPIERKPLAHQAISIAVLAALLAPLIFTWVRQPHCRIYGAQHDADDGVLPGRRLPRVPEEMDLAGVRLNYGWLGHVQVTAIAQMADVSPTLAFPVLNVLMAAALFILVTATIQQLRPRHPATAPITAGLVLAGTLISGVLLSEILAPYAPGRMLRGLCGDRRVACLLQKHGFFDCMVIAIGLVAAMIYAIVASWQQEARRTWALLPSLLAATGLCYPLLFPPAARLSATLLVALRASPGTPCTIPLQRHRWPMAMLFAAAGILVLIYLRFLGRDRTQSVLVRPDAESMARGIITDAHAMGLWLLLAWPAARPRGGRVTSHCWCCWRARCP